MVKKIKSLILICLITAMIFPFGGVGIRSASAEVLPPFTSIVIDDGNAGYTALGTWRVSTGVKGYNNSSTRYTCCWQSLKLTFADDAAWRSKLRHVKVDDQMASVNLYRLKKGKLPCLRLCFLQRRITRSY